MADMTGIPREMRELTATQRGEQAVDPTVSVRGASRWPARDWATRVGVAVTVAAALALVGALTTHGFLTVANLKAILFTDSFIGIAAVSATVLMLSGNLFSLSLGTTISVAGIAFLAALHFGLAAAIIITLLLGAAIFALQGLIVGQWNANPIIVTIAAGSIQLGLTTKFTQGAEVTASGSSSAYKTLGEALLGVPFSFYVLVGATLLVAFLLARTVFGRKLYLMGENRVAARAAGMNVRWVTTGAFAVAGLAAATAGILLSSFNDTATMAVGGSYTYDAIAATLIGGTGIQGGHGSVWRAFFGALFLAALTNLLLLRGYSTGVQILVEGVAVLVAVLLIRISSSRRAR